MNPYPAVNALMSTWHRFARENRATEAATPEEFYGFRAEDVAHVHLYKQGIGKGVWFRLNDGRVFDFAGRPSEPQDHWYEPSAN